MPKPPVNHFRELVAHPSFPGRDWMRIYLRSIEATVELRQSSRRAYESVWKSFLTYLAEQGRNALTAEPKHAESFLKRYRPVTALRYGRLLERVYARHVADRVAPRNPFGELQSFLAQEEPRAPTHALEISSVADLIEALPEPKDWQEHRDQAVVVLAASAGLRLRELRELEVVQLLPTHHGLEVQPRGRTVHSREIRLNTAATAFLTEWLNVRRQLSLEQHSTVLFPSRTGDRLPVNTLYRRVRALLQTVYGEDALPHFGVGILRATFAYQFRARDAVVEAQHALGHRRITSTLRYLKHLKPISGAPR